MSILLIVLWMVSSSCSDSIVINTSYCGVATEALYKAIGVISKGVP